MQHRRESIGQDFVTVSRVDWMEAARQAGDGGFDAGASARKFSRLANLEVLKARLNVKKPKIKVFGMSSPSVQFVKNSGNVSF